MIKGLKIHGVKGVLKGLDELRKAISVGVTEKGLVAGVLTLQAAAQNRTPIDIGNLRASCFSVFGENGKVQGSGAFKTSKLTPEDAKKLQRSQDEFINYVKNKQAKSRGFTAYVAYGAYYSLYVHEGTKYMRGRPFLLEAKLAENVAIQKAIKKGIVQEVESRRSLIESDTVFAVTGGGI